MEYLIVFAIAVVIVFVIAYRSTKRANKANAYRPDAATGARRDDGASDSMFFGMFAGGMFGGSGGSDDSSDSGDSGGGGGFSSWGGDSGGSDYGGGDSGGGDSGGGGFD